jgi:hypothetical protein
MARVDAVGARQANQGSGFEQRAVMAVVRSLAIVHAMRCQPVGR